MHRTSSDIVFDLPWEFDPWEFAAEQGIRPDSTKEVHAAILEDDQLVAVLFTGRSGDCYAFDIAVDSQYRQRGYGSDLMDEALYEYDQMSDYMPELKLCLDAVNPIAVDMLRSRGFEVTKSFDGHTYMTREGFSMTHERRARAPKGMTVRQWLDWLRSEADELEMTMYDLPSDWDDVDASEDAGEWQPGAAVVRTARRLEKKYSKLLSEIYDDIDYLEKGIRDGRLG